MKSEVKSEKVKSESIFGPLNFFVFRYVEGGVLGNNYISIKKCRTTFMGMKFETSWGVAPRIFKNTLLERVFEKMVSNLSILEAVFEAKFQG